MSFLSGALWDEIFLKHLIGEGQKKTNKNIL